MNQIADVIHEADFQPLMAEKTKDDLKRSRLSWPAWLTPGVTISLIALLLSIAVLLVSIGLFFGSLNMKADLKTDIAGTINAKFDDFKRDEVRPLSRDIGDLKINVLGLKTSVETLEKWIGIDTVKRRAEAKLFIKDPQIMPVNLKTHDSFTAIYPTDDLKWEIQAKFTVTNVKDKIVTLSTEASIFKEGKFQKSVEMSPIEIELVPGHRQVIFRAIKAPDGTILVMPSIVIGVVELRSPNTPIIATGFESKKGS